MGETLTTPRRFWKTFTSIFLLAATACGGASFKA